MKHDIRLVLAYFVQDLLAVRFRITGKRTYLEPNSLLDGDLIEGVHRVFDALGDDPTLVRLHANLDRIIDYSLNTY